MRKLIVATGILVGWAVAAAAQDAAWKEYVYSEDDFAVSAPAEPKLEKQTIRVVGGTSSAHIYSVSAGERGAFMVFVYLRHRADRRSERRCRSRRARAPCARSTAR